MLFRSDLFSHVQHVTDLIRNMLHMGEKIAWGADTGVIDQQRAALSALRTRLAEVEGALRWAHDTLWEINPSNYDHDDVCKINDASVEVILGIAPLIGETHGKSPEWWAAHRKLKEPRHD